jgi:hypothetical protein
VYLQESRIVAISTEHQHFVQSRPVAEPAPSLRLQQLIDNGTVYVAQNLSHSQFATLQAIAGRVFKRHNPKHVAAHLDAALASNSREASPYNPPYLAFDYQLGLDELDTIARTRTGYPFAELPDEIQDAILSLITTHDLTSRSLDMALWLEDLQSNVATTL